jgi:hypothetical protein
VIEVWWKRQGEWIRTLTCSTLAEALEYANMDISHGHITERIELREKHSGEVIRTVFDSNW